MWHIRYRSTATAHDWLIDQLPVSVAHQILSANYFLRRSSGDPMRQVVGMGTFYCLSRKDDYQFVINSVLVRNMLWLWFKTKFIQSAVMNSCQFSIVVLAELINNNLSAAAAGRCFVLRCDAEIGIIKEILIIEGIMAATMLWIWGECRDVFRLNVCWHLTIPPTLSCFLPPIRVPCPKSPGRYILSYKISAI